MRPRLTRRLAALVVVGVLPLAASLQESAFTMFEDRTFSPTVLACMSETRQATP